MASVSEIVNEKEPKLEEGLQGHASDDSDSDDSDGCSFDDGRYYLPCSDEDMEKFLSDPDFVCETLTEQENEIWFTYLKQFRQSDGFDIDTFPRVPEMIGGLCPVDLKDESTMKDVTNCAEYAIGRHNDEKAEKLEFVNVIKANRGGSNPCMFLITLTARVIGTPDIKIYQAHVECLGNRPRLFMFRPKPVQGFDIDTFPRVPEMIGGLRPVNLKDESTMKDVTNCAEYAIGRHNDEKAEKLEFVNVIKSNRVSNGKNELIDKKDGS